MIPTLRGTLLVLGTSLFIGASTWAPALRWLALAYFGLSLFLLFLDWRLAGNVKRFEIQRQHDTKLSLAADNTIHLVVQNRSRRAAFFQLRDEPPAAFQADRQVLRGEVKPWQIWQGAYRVRPPRRGDYEFGDVTLRWRGPLGLAVRQGGIAAKAAVKVYPNLLDVQRYDLLLRRNRLQELGLRHSRQFGEGTEFERLREYLPDDDFRHIDWKATARRNRPITAEYQTERSQTIIAVLDTGRMMQSPVAEVAKLDYAVNAVLLLAYVASGKGDKVGMLTFDDDVTHFLSPHGGRGQFYRMLELLYRVESQPVEPDYRRALSYLDAKQRKRALVVVFTDLSGGISMQSLVSHVAVLARRSLPLVVTISDPDVIAAARQRPRDSVGMYQRAAATEWIEERQVALDSLRRQGVLTLDVPANQLSVAVINRYLELKGKMQL